jgi:hypothetical protein
MPRRGVAVAVVVILASLIILGLTSSFLVDWAWFSAVGYLGVFWTILGGKAALFFAVFAGSAIVLWVNGYLAHRFARRRGNVHRVDFEQIARGVQTLPELLGLMGQRLQWRLLIKRRGFSIAMTACAAKFCSNPICLSVNGRTSCRNAVIMPMTASSFRSGTISSVRTSPISMTRRRCGGAFWR